MKQKSWRNTKKIIVRKRDKSTVFMVMNRADYFQKLDDILSNTDNFSVVVTQPHS